MAQNWDGPSLYQSRARRIIRKNRFIAQRAPNQYRHRKRSLLPRRWRAWLRLITLKLRDIVFLTRYLAHLTLLGLTLITVTIHEMEFSTILSQAPTYTYNNNSVTSAVWGSNKGDNQATFSWRTLPITVISERPAQARLEPITYQVREGDNPEVIAKRFGLQPSTIIWANSAVEENPYLLSLGQILTIPPVDGVLHTVRENESITAIATKYEVDRRLIIEYEGNNLKSKDSMLTVNQLILVPGGIKREKPAEPIAMEPVPPTPVPPTPTPVPPTPTSTPVPPTPVPTAEPTRIPTFLATAILVPTRVSTAVLPSTRLPAPTYTVVPTRVPAPTYTQVATRVPLPTYTQVATRVPLPTYTVVPTRVPLPTYTVVPTRVPLPTYTLVPTRVPPPTYTQVPTRVPPPTYTQVPTRVPPPTRTPVQANQHSYAKSTTCCRWPLTGRITTQPSSWHMALDIFARSGTRVVSADAGRIVAAGWDNTGYGYRVIIQHGNGISTLYAHLSSYSVSYGDYVNKGVVIGRVGSTGRSTGPHLHFEVRRNNFRQNPYNWLP